MTLLAAPSAPLTHPARFTSDEVWALVLKHEAVLRRETRRFVPRHRRARDADDVYSECVLLRAHSIMATYDPAKGARPSTHLIKNASWYAYKWAAARGYTQWKVPRLAERPTTVSLDSARETGRDGLQEVSASVRELLTGMPQDMRDLLEWRYLKEYDDQEIASHLGVRASDVGGMVRAALFVARMQAE